MKLESFQNDRFDRGASRLQELLWVICQAMFFSSFLPGSTWRSVLLSIFGAKVGRRVVIKPGVRVKFPWRLILGNDCWIGENVWIDNLDWVTVGSNSCVSQGSYLCTGSHDSFKPTFDLISKPIFIDDQVWVGAFCKVAPGVTLARGSMFRMGSVITKSTGEWEIWGGNPCKKVKNRLSS